MYRIWRPRHVVFGTGKHLPQRPPRCAAGEWWWGGGGRANPPSTVPPRCSRRTASRTGLAHQQGRTLNCLARVPTVARWVRSRELTGPLRAPPHRRPVTRVFPLAGHVGRGVRPAARPRGCVCVFRGCVCCRPGRRGGGAVSCVFASAVRPRSEWALCTHPFSLLLFFFCLSFCNARLPAGLRPRRRASSLPPSFGPDLRQRGG